MVIFLSFPGASTHSEAEEAVKYVRGHPIQSCFRSITDLSALQWYCQHQNLDMRANLESWWPIAFVILIFSGFIMWYMLVRYANVGFCLLTCANFSSCVLINDTYNHWHVVFNLIIFVQFCAPSGFLCLISNNLCVVETRGT